MSFDDLNAYWKFAKSARARRTPLDEVAKTFLSDVRETMPERSINLEAGSQFYRAQAGVVYPENELDAHVYGYGADRMLPKLEYIAPGRCNQANQVVVYLASTVETAISEIRPWTGQEVSLALFETEEPMRLADLSKGHAERKDFIWEQRLSQPISEWDKPVRPPTQEEINQQVWNHIDRAFSMPVTRSDADDEYAPTQILSELFRTMGFDGVVYKSQFGEEKGYNIALFSARHLQIRTTTPFRIKGIKVDYEQFDNPSYICSEKKRGDK